MFKNFDGLKSFGFKFKKFSKNDFCKKFKIMQEFLFLFKLIYERKGLFLEFKKSQFKMIKFFKFV